MGVRALMSEDADDLAAIEERAGDPDRLLHPAYVLNIKGLSYRLQELEETLGRTRCLSLTIHRPPERLQGT